MVVVILVVVSGGGDCVVVIACSAVPTIEATEATASVDF